MRLKLVLLTGIVLGLVAIVWLRSITGAAQVCGLAIGDDVAEYVCVERVTSYGTATH